METGSVIETAKLCKVSTVKARKVLITEGLWSSATSERIGELLMQNYTSAEIALMLHMSMKNVQAYMPYERGTYGGDDWSLDALRADIYRQRMRSAAAMQVASKSIATDEERTEVKMKKNLNVIKLHLKLDLTDASKESIEILKKYGSMKKSMSRDILVSSDITLHALHYAILRAFGWQNGHLHHFSMPKETFDLLTEEKFTTWAKLAGIYFRFPTKDFEDIYWDDDYKETESFKSWLKRKYTGPYKYKGFGEHYLHNQIEVQEMFDRHDEITVREFDFHAKPEPKVHMYQVKLEEATVDQVQHAFVDMMCHELLERLPLMQVLKLSGVQAMPMPWVRHGIMQKLAEFDVDDVLDEYYCKNFPSMKQRRAFVEQYNVAAEPVAHQLRYSYDYGDGWEVLITAEEVYFAEDDGGWKHLGGDMNVDVPEEALEEVVEKYRPVCIAKDGIELVDDVGGIHGFCEFLKLIYGIDPEDPDAEALMQEREDTLNWAKYMGWTGRKISPKQTL